MTPIDFTDQQKRFLAHRADVPAQLLAGPGTGKSATVIEFARRAVGGGLRGVRLLTFTRAATAELMEKLPKDAQEIRPNTFHSFATSLVLQNPGTAEVPQPLRIISDWEWDNLVRPRISGRLNLGKKWRDADTLRKERAAKWESLTEDETEKIDDETRAQFEREWQFHRNVFGYTEISEVPYLLYTALRSHPDFDFGDIKLLIVDEYQDLNACDLACLRMLSARGVTIFGAGDDDQSIYGFRKAHPAGIRRFPQEYKHAQSYPLSIAHRFGEDILRWANYVINFDSSRKEGKVALRPSVSNPKGIAAYLEFRGHAAERRGIVALVCWLHDREKVPLEEILILARTKGVIKPIFGELKEAGIPTACPTMLEEDFEGDAWQTTIARLHLLVTKEDSLAWWALLKLTRGIGDKSIESVIQEARHAKVRFGETLLRLHSEESLNSMAGNTAEALVTETLSFVEATEMPDKGAWGEWILQLSSKKLVPELPEGIQTILRGIDGRYKKEVSLEDYLSRIEPTAKDILQEKRKGVLRVMTMTNSKGLTVEACLVAGCESNIIPLPQADPDEECRLLYVAMTRARKYLYLTRALRRTGITARTGKESVQTPRTGCQFLEGGPVEPTSGERYVEGLIKEK